jgi:four helix bundle protein
MALTPEELRIRTKKFGLRIIRLYRALPRSAEAQVMGRQLLRCGTSVGANYRAACRSRSDAEFVAKLGVVIEEADETAYWLELLEESGPVAEQLLRDLKRETDELTRIFVAARFSTKRR